MRSRCVFPDIARQAHLVWRNTSEMERTFPGRYVRKFGHTPQGCPLFWKFCKFVFAIQRWLFWPRSQRVGHLTQGGRRRVSENGSTLEWKYFRNHFYVDKYWVQLDFFFKKSNAPLVCTCLFCLRWLGNVQRFRTRTEPLYGSLDTLFCNIFTTVVVCIRSLLLWSIKRNDDVEILVSCTIRPWKFPEIHTGNLV